MNEKLKESVGEGGVRERERKRERERDNAR